MHLVRPVLVAALLVACGSPEPGPPLETCFSGDYFAECGGDGAPRFACRDDGECKWFTGGVVANGFEASNCPADDLCCHDEWPFDELDSETHFQVWSYLYGAGTIPWDRERSMNLALAVDATPIEARLLECSAEQPGNLATPCERPDPFAGAQMGDTLSFQIGEVNYYGWRLWLEIDPEYSRARACRLPFTDVIGGACTSQQDVVCATSGSIGLTEIPEAWGDPSSVGARVELRFADGLTISGAF